MTDSQPPTATATAGTATDDTGRGRAAVLGLLVLLAVSTALTGIGTAVQTTETTQAVGTNDTAAFVVGVDTDGDATVAVSYTFDLDDEARQAAFDQLRQNDSAREAFRRDFERQLAGVAAEAGETTGREMAVSDSTITFETVDDTGVATLSVTWTDLAAVEGNRLVVTEPFASGFETDRPLHVVAPEGYAVTDAAPDPDAPTGETASWAAGSDLSGFEVVVSDTAAETSATETENAAESETAGDDAESDADASDDSGEATATDTQSSTDGTGAGFGALPVVAALALVGLSLLACRARR